MNELPEFNDDKLCPYCEKYVTTGDYNETSAQEVHLLRHEIAKHKVKT